MNTVQLYIIHHSMTKMRDIKITWTTNSLFLSCREPLYQSNAWFTTIYYHMEMSSICMFPNEISFSLERMGTRPALRKKQKINRKWPILLIVHFLSLFNVVLFFSNIYNVFHLVLEIKIVEINCRYTFIINQFQS